MAMRMTAIPIAAAFTATTEGFSVRSENQKGPAKAGPFQVSDGAAGGNRTHDLSLTKDALYH